MTDETTIEIPEHELQALYNTLADATGAAATGRKNRCAALASDAKQHVLEIREEYGDD